MTAHLSPSNICFANFCLEISSFYFNIKIYDFLYSSCDKKILEWAYFDRIWNLTFIIIQTLKSVSSLVNCKTDTHFILNEIFLSKTGPEKVYQSKKKRINKKPKRTPVPFNPRGQPSDQFRDARATREAGSTGELRIFLKSNCD